MRPPVVWAAGERTCGGEQFRVQSSMKPQTAANRLPNNLEGRWIS